MSQSNFRYFTIFGAMRSGSNLLEQSLNQFSGIDCHGELYNPVFVSDPKVNSYLGFTLGEREKKPFDLIEKAISQDPDVIAGFRMFNGHDERVATHCLQDKGCGKIILQRDPLESFISLKIAQKTDQWLLRDSPHKKEAKVHFNAAEFYSYLDKSTTYYDRIRRILQETGQAGYWIKYPEQKELAILNGIAGFLGLDEKIKKLTENIRRQNPGPLSEKVENFEEMQKELSLTGDQSHLNSGPHNPILRANIPKMVTCISQPLLFVPTPGGPTEEVLRWMNAIDCGDHLDGSYSAMVKDGGILHSGHSQRTLYEWMHASPSLVTFTAVRHPLPRVYDVFMRKIFLAGPNTYDVIRNQLQDNFDVEMPERKHCKTPDREQLINLGYGIREHRNSFHSFLRFLKPNLLGQTSIRIDGLWALQMSFMAGFNSAVPVSVIAKEGKLDAAFHYIENSLDIPPPKLGPPIKPEFAFELDEIYTRQTENLARKIYGADYARFGFDDYQAALDV